MIPGPVRRVGIRLSACEMLFVWVLMLPRPTVCRPCRVPPMVICVFLMSSTWACLLATAVSGRANRLELEHKL